MSSTTALTQPKLLDVDQIIIKVDESRVFESIDQGATWICHFYSPDGQERLASLDLEDLSPNQQAMYWPLLTRARLTHQHKSKQSA